VKRDLAVKACVAESKAFFESLPFK
jgi:hypothetical protein